MVPDTTIDVVPRCQNAFQQLSFKYFSPDLDRHLNTNIPSTLQNPNYDSYGIAIAGIMPAKTCITEAGILTAFALRRKAKRLESGNFQNSDLATMSSTSSERQHTNASQ
jgi:hypothetical protein